MRIHCSRGYFTILLFIVVGIAVGWLAGLPARAQAVEDEPERSAYHQPLETLYRPDLAAGNAAPSPAKAAAFPAVDSYATSYAYTQIDPYWGNYEVYYYNYISGNHVRLTEDKSHDIAPRCNRDCSRIAFSSNRQNGFDIFVINRDGSGLTPLTWAFTHEVYPYWSPDGTRLVYQSDATSGGDIYVMNADGSGVVRLTTHEEYDGMPSWSPDGRKIAFVSRRSGGYRVWVMNPDGSSPVQLSQQSYSARPLWSADGKQIFFDADADNDGWTELWVMDANGANQRQLFQSAEPNTDIMVAGRHPSGSWVSVNVVTWIAYNGDWYWTNSEIRYMDVSGGYPQTFLADAIWYHDWRTNVSTLPTTTVAPLEPASTATFELSWQAPQNGVLSIRHYDVQVKDGPAGVWTDLVTGSTENTAVFTGKGGHAYYFRVRAVDYHYNTEPWPDTYDAFTVIESQSPETYMSALQPYSKGSVQVCWNGEDRGGSGMSSFDVQVKAGQTGDWSALSSSAEPGCAMFTGAQGSTYYFRERGTDLAQNQEPWPDDYDTHTTFYEWRMSGGITDNTGAPVQGAQVQTAGAAASSGAEGAYSLLELVPPAADPYAVGYSKNGYGALPATPISSTFDASLQVVMPPKVDLIQNGGFETWGGESPAWALAGDLPVSAAATAAHTGSSGLYLGQISDLVLEDYLVIDYQDVLKYLVDKNGQAHYLWQTPYPNEIYYASKRPGAGWSTPYNLSNSPAIQSHTPGLFVDDHGDVYAVWVELSGGSHTLKYARKPLGGNWSAAQTVVVEYDYLAPLVKVDGSGNVHIIWVVDGLPRYRQRTGAGVWLAVEDFANEKKVKYPHRYDMQVDSQGGVHFVWGSTIGVEHAYRKSAAAWKLETLTRLLSSGSIFSLDTGLDAGESLHILWSHTWQYSSATLNHVTCAGEGPCTSISRIYTWDSYQGDFDASLGITPQGDLYALWKAVPPASADYDTLDLLYLFKATAGSGWSQPMQITESMLFNPRLSVSPNGQIHLVWREGAEFLYAEVVGNSPWLGPVRRLPISSTYLPAEVVFDAQGQPYLPFQNASTAAYVRPTYAGTSGDVWLSQVVTIPETMQNPVLSFMHWLGASSGATVPVFEVTINDGLATYEVYASKDSTAGWEHRWVDVGAWWGQTVTVTFHLHQPADKPHHWLYLDDLSLGSAHPDLYTAVQAKFAEGAPGKPLVYEITYGNRGGVQANGVVLTNTLPDGLQFVSASVAPVVSGQTLTWTLGDLPASQPPQTITVTVTVQPSARLNVWLVNRTAIAAASAELEKANNTASVRTYFGYRLRLPMIVK